MAGGITSVGNQLMVNHISRGTAYSAPTTIAAGLTTAQTTISQTELTLGGMTNYSRAYAGQLLTLANWSGAVLSGNYQQSTYNTGTIDFNTASGGTATVTGVVLYDATTAGNALFWETLGTAISSTTGTHITIAPATLVVGITIMGQGGGGVGSGLSTTYAQGVINHLTGKAALAQPAALALSLCTAVCTATTLGTETTYTGYAATRLTPGVTAASGNVSPSIIYPSATQTFGSCTAAPGTPIIAFGLMDNATVGSGVLIAGGLITSTTMSVGLTPTISTSQPFISMS